MAKFPEREEFIKQVAEHALDKFTYCGRTIREWVAVITSTDDEFGDDIDLMLRKLRNESILCFHCDYYSDDDPDNRCDASNPENCDVRKTAKGAAALIERLFAVNCEKNAEMVLLTRERDEWQQRAEAAEHDLSIARHCATCELNGVNWNACAECAINVRKLWKWRGPCAENGGVKND